jgi:hypothetical protein
LFPTQRAFPTVFLKILVPAAAGLFLAACNASAPGPLASAPAPTQASGAAPAEFRLPQGAGCSGAIARWRALQDNDLATGHVARSVYDSIQNDIRQASAACQAGRDAEAVGIVRASRLRHGYPAG